jgi:hypothetical protein
MKLKTLSFLPTAALALCTLGFLSSCDKDDESNNNTYTVSATMNGSKEVPSNTSTGTGTLTGTYDANDNVLTYSATWTGLTGTATAAHFHGPASATTTASPVVTFVIVGNGATGVKTLTDAEEQDLLNGMWYVNVHTANYTGGEIRGQVSAVK